jgi:hypothetical protein
MSLQTAGCFFIGTKPRLVILAEARMTTHNIPV